MRTLALMMIDFQSEHLGGHWKRKPALNSFSPEHLSKAEHSLTGSGKATVVADDTLLHRKEDTGHRTQDTGDC